MNASVYILWSNRLKKYYVGSTTYNVLERLVQHNAVVYENSFTAKGRPWTIYLILDCNSVKEARKIEYHIKRMKSKTYIENLKKYPEMQEKLRERYTD